MLGLSRRELIKGLAAILCIVGISWFALEYFVPAPPAEFTIVTGSPNQTYEAIGKRYREILARSHVKVEVRNTPGAVENLKLLNNQKSGIQVGIVQGGVGNSDKSPDLLSLGRVTYQFFWIFYRGTETWDDVRQLKGKRIALGLEGSIDFAATGREHDLHVIFKGFPDRRQLELSRTLFSGIPINSIELNDEGFDIGSYAKNGIQPLPYFSKYIQPNSRPQLVEAF